MLIRKIIILNWNLCFQRPYTVQFKNVTSYSLNDICQINSSISNANSISVFVNVGRTIPSYYTKSLIKIETSDGIYGLELINKTLDTCKFFDDPTYEPIVQVFYRELTRTGTFPKRCPIEKVWISKFSVVYSISNCFPHRNYTSSKMFWLILKNYPQVFHSKGSKPMSLCWQRLETIWK